MADVLVLVSLEEWVIAYARDVCDLFSRGSLRYFDVGFDLRWYDVLDSDQGFDGLDPLLQLWWEDFHSVVSL